MPKPKQFLKDNKKKSKHAAQVPATADEYLAAGVDFEEAGEKWRGGDAAKSTRFFIRAIECYDEALKKFPTSFDLAYNKARVQYELTQHPKLLAQLPGTLLDLLQTALESSQYALGLKEDNADALFNAAQILHSLAETSTETHVDLPNPAALLRQALLYFKRCLTIQEYHLAEFTTQQDAISGGTSSQEPTLSGAPSQNGSATLSSDQVQEERWATIVEPVTNDSILDTILAQLETLTTFCSITTTEHAIAGISSLEDFANSLLTEKLPVYMAGTNRKFEVDLTCASFFAALANTKFFLQEIDFAVFTQAVHDAFASLDLTGNPEGLVAKAEALIAYNNAFSGGSAIKEINDARWKALTSALENLTSASKIPTAKNVAKLHILRGDVELYRFQLGSPPCSYDVATKNAGVLLKNAEKIYKGAELTARATGVENDMQEALTKVALVKSLQGDVEQIQALMGGNARKFGKPVLDEAVDEALVTVEQLAAIGIS